jgi:hypothetical protein
VEPVARNRPADAPTLHYPGSPGEEGEGVCTTVQIILSPENLAPRTFASHRSRSRLVPEPARSSGCGVAQVTDAIVICLDALVLPLDERSYVGRQVLVERCFITDGFDIKSKFGQ